MHYRQTHNTVIHSYIHIYKYPKISFSWSRAFGGKRLMWPPKCGTPTNSKMYVCMYVCMYEYVFFTQTTYIYKYSYLHTYIHTYSSY